MKLSRILVENFLGVRALDVQVNRPILLVAGANAAGKSSVQEAVRLALTGETVRVGLKKEYPLLISEGGRSGEVGVWAEGNHIGGVQLPDGQHGEELPAGVDGATLRCVLDAQRFARLPLDERRKFLFDLTGLKVDGKAVQERLARRGASEGRIAAVLPMLRSGFPAASEYAAKKATEAKGAWRAVTTETYGSKKADGWKATPPAAPEDSLNVAQAELKEAGEIHSTCKVELATLAQRRQALAAAKEKAAKLKAAAEPLGKLPKLIALAEADLVEFLPKVESLRSRAGGKKREGLVHDMADYINATCDDDAAQALLERYTVEHGAIGGKPDSEAAASLPEHEKGLALLQSRLANLRRDLEAAKTAKAQFDGIEYPEAVDDDQLEALVNAETQARQKQADLQAKVARIEAAARAIAEAEGKTKKAAEHHADVAAWSSIADALAPDGIPGDMLAEALTPLNGELSVQAIATGWSVPRIGADMAITADGRPYTLLSESEKWRIDAMIAAAISRMSGLKLLVLDRMDVLDLQGRSACLTWLNDMAENGELDTALVFATLKAIPAQLPESFQSVWLENGHAKTFKEAA